MELGSYYDEALLAKKVYDNLVMYNNNAESQLELDLNAKSATVKIPASNGNPAYEYRVIDVENNTQTGYYGVAFEKFVNGSSANEKVIAHRGTNDPVGETKDFDYANKYIASNGVLGNFEQLKNAFSLYNRVVENTGVAGSEIKQVGHSLGGGLAKMVSVSSGSTAVVFNAPKVKHLLDNFTNFTIEDYISSFENKGNDISIVVECLKFVRSIMEDNFANNFLSGTPIEETFSNLTSLLLSNRANVLNSLSVIDRIYDVSVDANVIETTSNSVLASIQDVVTDFSDNEFLTEVVTGLLEINQLLINYETVQSNGSPLSTITELSDVRDLVTNAEGPNETVGRLGELNQLEIFPIYIPESYSDSLDAFFHLAANPATVRTGALLNYHKMDIMLEFIKHNGLYKVGHSEFSVKLNTRYKKDFKIYLESRLGDNVSEVQLNELFDKALDSSYTVDYVKALIGGGSYLEIPGNNNYLIIGVSRFDDIYSGGGNDFIITGGKNDYLSGGRGNDVLYAGSGNDELYGGDGDDYLNGGSGHDELYGGRGDDSLDAGRGLNKLYGGFGNDNYHLSFANYTLNIIYDNSGTDRLLLDNRVSFNQNYSLGDNGFLENFASGYTAEYRNNNLKITKIDTQSETVIREFESGQFGIYLIDEDNDEDMNTDDNGDGDASGGIIDGIISRIVDFLNSFNILDDLLVQIEEIFGLAESRISPIILDLDEDGVVETTDLNSDDSVYFDHGADGFAEASGWVGIDDGFLVKDLNGDGQITSGLELFGNETPLANGTTSHGFEALAELDSNDDGVINVEDEAFSELQVWQDSNVNAMVDEGELMSLVQWDISEISLESEMMDTVDEYGNLHLYEGSYTKTTTTTNEAGEEVSSSTEYKATDVWVRVNLLDVIDLDEIELSEEVLSLPNISNYGFVIDFQKAMQLDESLRVVVKDFLINDSEAERLEIIDTILYKWAGVEAIDPESRGNFITDARKLEVLENFIAEDFSQLGRSSSPRTQASKDLLEAYDTLSEGIYQQLMIKGNHKYLYDMVLTRYDLDSDILVLDFGLVSSYLQELIREDAQLGKQLLSEFMASFRTIDLNVVLLDEFVESFSDASVDVQEIVSTPLSGLIGTFVDDILEGAASNDYLDGRFGNDTIYGDSGDDTIIGGQGDDLLNGGSGSDEYRFGGEFGWDIISENIVDGDENILVFNDLDSSDILVSRSQYDLYLYSIDGNNGVTIEDWFSSDNRPIHTIEFSDGVSWDVGITEINITVIGVSPNRDIIYAGASDDDVDLLAGDDVIYANDGDDIIRGNLGDDYLQGGLGNDIYEYRLNNFGRDRIFDEDSTTGNSDTIKFYASSGINLNDLYITRDSRDLIIDVLASDDSIILEDWFVNSNVGIERIEFADGSHITANELEIQSNTGTINDDYLGGGNESDNIDGLSGNDLVYAGAGNDIINGGTGEDKLYGEAGDDTINGGTGNDNLQGGSGNDTIDGGVGNDNLYGNIGSDTYIFSIGGGEDTVFELRGQNNDIDSISILGDLTIDDIHITRNTNDLFIEVISTEDRLIVNNYYFGNEIEALEFLSDGLVFDQVSIEEQANTATIYNDFIVGIDGGDTLNALAGNDQVYGSAGDDSLQGGTGDDFLSGGIGSDTYIFNLGDGIDIIYDGACTF